MQKRFLLLLSFLILLGCSDQPKQGGDPSKILETAYSKSELSVPYLTFSKGYESLNSELISSAYTTDAILINVYNDSEPESYKSRKNIGAFFAENLERAKNENVALKIIFKISKRKVLKETVLDNGFYKLELVGRNQVTTERYGKFSIVLKKESNDWKFFVDTNASSTKEEYQNAKSI
ncbi:hypothetical protein [Flagellimonas sp.]|uniref:hypothetical protein n=1 Tax=Flagellimonas sp. TaxID=2058762 RepID=UPI003B52CDAA